MVETAIKMAGQCQMCKEATEERWRMLFEVHQIGAKVQDSLIKAYIDDMKAGERVFSMDNIDYMQTKLEDMECFNVRVNTIVFFLCDDCKDIVIQRMTEGGIAHLADHVVKSLGEGKGGQNKTDGAV